MNEIFFIILTLSIAMLTFTSPSQVLSAMLTGTEKGVELSIRLLAVYAVWLGAMQVMEECGLTAKISKLLRRPIKAIFGNVSPKSAELISMNLSANLLGAGGVATPMGIAATKQLDGENNVYAMHMLFILAAGGVQLIPSSVVALRESSGSLNAGDIILPSILVTAVSTILAAVVLRLVSGGKKL